MKILLKYVRTKFRLSLALRFLFRDPVRILKIVMTKVFNHDDTLDSDDISLMMGHLKNQKNRSFGSRFES